MTQPSHPPRVRLSRAGRGRLEHTSANLHNRFTAAVRLVLTWIWAQMRQLVPRQAPPPPLTILPGHDGLIDVKIAGPRHQKLHLYAEAEATTGQIALNAQTAQIVDLGETGQAEKSVRVTPIDYRATGHVNVHILAVDPIHPEQPAARLDPVPVAQAGTLGIWLGFIGLGLLVGFAAQIYLGLTPVLGICILVGLIGMMFWAEPIGKVRYQPWRLLPRGQRLTSLAWAFGGMVIWGAMMAINGEAEAQLVADADPTQNCDGQNPRQECNQIYVLLDNITVIAACFGLACCVLLALAPAIRPKTLIIRLLIFTALTPLMIYDFTLLGYLAYDLAPDGAGQMTVLITEAIGSSFSNWGWSLAAIGVAALALRTRLGGWRFWAAIAGAAIYVALPISISAYFASITEFDLSVAIQAILASLVSACLMYAISVPILRLLLPPPGRRKWLWSILHFIWLPALIGVYIVLILNQNQVIPAGEASFLGPLSIPLSLLWLLAETELALWLRRRRRARAEAAPAAAAEPAAEPA